MQPGSLGSGNGLTSVKKPLSTRARKRSAPNGAHSFFTSRIKAFPFRAVVWHLTRVPLMLLWMCR